MYRFSFDLFQRVIFRLINIYVFWIESKNENYIMFSKTIHMVPLIKRTPNRNIN